MVFMKGDQQMKTYENIIIGFGKGGKTLAAELALSGQSVALIERDANMYGGTCINVACIPSKALEHHARLSHGQGGDFSVRSERYKSAVEDKRKLTSMLRQKNYDKLINAGVHVYTGTATFSDSHHIQVSLTDGTNEELYGERFFINTGSRPFIPPVNGLKESSFTFTSATLMEVDELPRRLVIIGGGYIGLEFASYYTNFGSEVTIIQHGEKFLPHEDKEVSTAILMSLEERGVKILSNSSLRAVRDQDDHARLTLEVKGESVRIEADVILVATGRHPNLRDLNPEAAGINLTEGGAVKTDELLRTSVSHIWAMGDVVGGLQFTYISLDDFRIVKDQLLGTGERTTKNRGNVPYTIFLDPPLSRIGMTEEDALEKGHEIKTARLPAAAIPKAHILKSTTGILKAIVDAETDLILGAHFYCAESHEMINLIKLAMDAKLPYTVLRDSIFNHPTMSESLNDLFHSIK